MTRFAFYGRVSTEDQQDPESSRGWQLARSRQVIDPAGGEIVAEFFDIGQSRSLPWKRRPEASRLLEAFKDTERGFDAVVIGEPQRAFLRQPVRPHVPRLRPLQRRAVGPGGGRRRRPRIGGTRPRHEPLRRDEQGRTLSHQDPRALRQVKILVRHLRDIVSVLADAAPSDKAELYRELGIELTYHPDGQVRVEALPRGMTNR